MKEQAFRADAREAKGLHDGSISRVVRPIEWETYDPHYNLRFSGAEAGYYCTGSPSSGWVIRSRGAGSCWNDRTKPQHCPFGVVGDRLWVQEMFGWVDHIEHGEPPVRQVTDPAKGWKRGVLDFAECPEFVWTDGNGFAAENKDGSARSEWKSSTQMPRWASRTLLDVTDVRVVRLDQVAEADYFAMGFKMPPIESYDVIPINYWWVIELKKMFPPPTTRHVKWNPWLWLGSVQKVEA